MQTLWTRVAQTRTACRCSQCLPALQATSRRATVAATQRVPKYITSSTLWYSGVFAVAATYDASRKMRRREEWERVIAEAQDELEVVEATIEQNTRAEIVEETVEKNIEDQQNDIVKSTATSETTNETTNDPKLSYDGDVLDISRELERHLDTTISTIPARINGENANKPILLDQVPFKPFHMAPQSIYADALQKQRLATKCWSGKKLELVEMCMDLLQLKAFAEINERGLLADAKACVPDEYARFFALDRLKLAGMYNVCVSDLKRLKNSRWDEYAAYSRSYNGTPLCRYEQDAAGDHLATTRELNHSLRQLFKRHNSSEPDDDAPLSTAELLAKVWYNVHVSPAPPNIDTFNILILGFARAREPAQARNVISALHLCHVRPNEVTLSAILRFFTATRDARAFSLWFGYVRGWYDGLSLARPDVVVNRAARDRLVDFRPPGAALGKVVQLPTPTPMVFGAIVRGVLHFDGFAAAWDTCRGMRPEGWQLNMSGWAPLLKDCARRADATAGFAIWDEILRLRRRSRRRGQGRKVQWTTDPIHLDTYTSMLRLCAKCDRRDLFEQVLAQAGAEHEIGPEPLAELIKTAMREDVEFRYSKRMEAEDEVLAGAAAAAVYGDAETRAYTFEQNDSLGASLPTADYAADEARAIIRDARFSSLPSLERTSMEQTSEHRSSNISAPTHRTVPSRPITDELSADSGPSDSAETVNTSHMPPFRKRVVYTEPLLEKPSIWIW